MFGHSIFIVCAPLCVCGALPTCGGEYERCFIAAIVCGTTLKRKKPKYFGCVLVYFMCLKQVHQPVECHLREPNVNQTAQIHTLAYRKQVNSCEYMIIIFRQNSLSFDVYLFFFLFRIHFGIFSPIQPACIFVVAI